MINTLKEAKHFILHVRCISLKQAAEEIDFSRPHLTEVLNGKTPCGARLAKALKEWSGGEIILKTNGADAPNEAGET